MLIAKAYEYGYVKELMLLVTNGVVTKRWNYVDKNICNLYKCLDVRDLGILLPGFLDIHTHLRGLNLSYKEDEESGTKAAVHGGFTVVVDMPNTIPKIDNLTALNMKMDALKRKSVIDFGIYVSPTMNEEELRKMLLVEGVVGVKIFPQDLHLMPIVTRVLKSFNGLGKKIVIVHAEDPAMVDECSAGNRFICRSLESEISALNKLIPFAHQGVKIHITHITNVLTMIIAKRHNMTVDTCPHYLYLDSGSEKEVGCLAKVNPPLRFYTTRLILLKFLKFFDAISSDHAPHSYEEKNRDFYECPSGIASLDIMGSLVLNLVSLGILELNDVVNLLSKGPAKILGLRRWGCLYSDCIASYTVVDLDKEVYVNQLKYFSKASFTPYKGMKLKGAVRATIVRGNIVYMDNEFIEKTVPLPITVFTR